MAEKTLAQLVYELTQNQVKMVKSVNFGRGVATNAQLSTERRLIKAISKYGLSVDEYFELAERG